MSSSKEEENMLTLRSNDNEFFSVQKSVAVQSSVILKYMVKEGCAADTIPLSKVNARTLALVLEYLNKHADSATSDENKDKFDSEFMNRSLEELIEILWAANYLGTKCLLSSVAVAIANVMKEMTVEEVRKGFGVENDYTPEEEAEMRKADAWAFE